MIKIGVFGGAFNPVHNGHINMVKEAFADLKLQKMLIIPTCVSPHKSNKGLIAFEDRAKMCELAFADEIASGKFEISDIEKRMGGTSYTINTIRELKRQYPDDAVFYLIIGGAMRRFWASARWLPPQEKTANTAICVNMPQKWAG